MTDIPEPTPELHDMIARDRNTLFMKYFVLKPAGDDHYAIASRRAMQTYARWIGEHGNPDLASQLNAWAHREHEASFNRRVEEDGTLPEPLE